MDIDANGISFNCRIDGPGPADTPWIVFSNSLATDLGLWDRQVARLADRFNILRYDTRGHGRTQATPPPYSFDQLTADAVALMDSVGIDRAHWVGLSLGGSTGIAMALNHAHRLRSLAVCDSRARTDPEFVRAWQTLDFEDRLGEITLPVLFMAGASDRSCPPEAARAMHDRVAGSACVILDPASHISNLENPAQFNAALLAYLDRAR